jgi:Aspartyl/Asparaginyl beta-hydroxylase
VTDTTVIELDDKFDHSRILSEYSALHAGVPDIYNITWLLRDGRYEVDCPYTIEVCESLKTKLKFNQAVFRLMQNRTTLNWHRDGGLAPIAWHIPILTNSGCFYVYEDRTYKMQELGKLYSVRNSMFHTFINAGRTPRLHLHILENLTLEEAAVV